MSDRYTAPCVNFQGCAREALEFYHSILGRPGWRAVCRGQPAVQGRSFSGLRTAQMCVIRSPATSNANTVTVTPAC